MKLKRTVSSLLCILMIFSFACVPSYASDNKGNKVPFVINAVEEISGMFVSFIAKYWNILTDKSETDISAAEPLNS